MPEMRTVSDKPREFRPWSNKAYTLHENDNHINPLGV